MHNNMKNINQSTELINNFLVKHIRRIQNVNSSKCLSRLARRISSEYGVAETVHNSRLFLISYAICTETTINR